MRESNNSGFQWSGYFDEREAGWLVSPGKYHNTFYVLNVLYSSFDQQMNKVEANQSMSIPISAATLTGVFVGANSPFGAVQLGPSNIYKGWDWS
jgi:hypothetical protein